MRRATANCSHSTTRTLYALRTTTIVGPATTTTCGTILNCPSGHLSPARERSNRSGTWHIEHRPCLSELADEGPNAVYRPYKAQQNYLYGYLATAAVHRLVAVIWIVVRATPVSFCHARFRCHHALLPFIPQQQRHSLARHPTVFLHRRTNVVLVNARPCGCSLWVCRSSRIWPCYGPSFQPSPRRYA